MELRRDGHLRVGGSEERRARFLSTLRGLGVVGELWSEAVLRERTGVRAEGAVWLEDGAVDPEALLGALRSTLQHAGVQIETATARRVGANGVSDLEERFWPAERVVLACGVGLEALSEHDWSYRQEPGWGARYDGSLAFGYSLEAAGQTLVPCSAGGWRLAGSDGWSGEPPLRALVDWEGSEVARYQGSRCFTPDGLPVAGRREDGVYLLGALGRNGLLTAPLLALGLAASMLGADPPEWLLPFSPQRPGIGQRKSWARRPYDDEPSLEI